LVTGASSGIGADLARELARDGHDLILVARREELMQILATELAMYGARSTIVATNLGTCLAASRLGAELESRGLPAPDVLVNDAGFGDYADFIHAEPTKLSEMLHLNVVALTELTRVFLPGMVARRRGRVLLVGSMATTYRAQDSVLHSAVALKVINQKVAEHPSARARFLREARAAARLHHPNVASVSHYGEQDGECYYVMELVEGETLETRVRREGPLPPALVLEIGTSGPGVGGG
jgi:NAD(P)-dependent dehydrogenase (short-subunit alcohol dehydrogenase family)